MNTNATSLDRLHDIVVPSAVPWWPPAPGWYWVLMFLGACAVVWALRSFIHWQKNRYRREALAELWKQEQRMLDPRFRAPALAAIAELLKRTALTAFPREMVATLTGDQWFSFLARTSGKQVFPQSDSSLLEQATYDPRIAAKVEEARARELVNQVRLWLAHHRMDLSNESRS